MLKRLSIWWISAEKPEYNDQMYAVSMMAPIGYLSNAQILFKAALMRTYEVIIVWWLRRGKCYPSFTRYLNSLHIQSFNVDIVGLTTKKKTIRALRRSVIEKYFVDRRRL